VVWWCPPPDLFLCSISENSPWMNFRLCEVASQLVTGPRDGQSPPGQLIQVVVPSAVTSNPHFSGQLGVHIGSALPPHTRPTRLSTHCPLAHFRGLGLRAGRRVAMGSTLPDGYLLERDADVASVGGPGEHESLVHYSVRNNHYKSEPSRNKECRTCQSLRKQSSEP
jgi:hypothetical protein